MKKLILILLALSIAPQLMARQGGKTGTDKITNIDTPHLTRPPKAARIEDLISKLPSLPQDTSNNAIRIRMDCRDVFQAGTPGSKLPPPGLTSTNSSTPKKTSGRQKPRTGNGP
ncbi:hypothetical protein [Mucilaginibacter myungsuensis]|uniref:Uncharacterized protein n=1 Tax=Mucilaginibacter myungsuensis TaxID=649104 RepID=A0A929PWD5_9SPHI|nr:hypothetical protein [Mucilaginibacter myungsuensis]MBE9661250.1 hypothetical protein [Mucilaginibacter myungsuensis]MDN3597393.1 hypothetical protein [Mucilaginibacter myungsuensis]